MKLSNTQIYNYSQALNSAFTEKELYLPAKINFYIQKNAQTLAEAAKGIEDGRMAIIRHYGEPDEENGTITVPPEKIEVASNELNDLFGLEQDLKIYTVDIEKFGEMELSLEQMNALMFMVEGD